MPDKPVFMYFAPGATYAPHHVLARDGKVIVDDDEKVNFTTSESEIDKYTSKPVPEAICFDYQDGDTRYTQ